MATYKKKLIEVALPLEAINRESAHEKSVPRKGHPATLHLWWARRPLAACRAVIFASLVDDPSAHPERFPTDESQQQERERLFELIESLVKWENSDNEIVLEAARREISDSTDGNPPPVLDPFCGGGSIPLEAQRLGLKAYASDLNPVAVLITKALIEIPPKFARRPPVNPDALARMGSDTGWKGGAGLADDIRYYGKWIRDEAEKRIGHLYPNVQLPKAEGGGEATVIAWLWARTVKCPNPACGAQMPLVRSFWLSSKRGRKAWVEPKVDSTAKTVQFEVSVGEGAPTEGTVNRKGATCIVCGTSVPFTHVRSEGKSGRMPVRLMAIVAEGDRRRTYLSPSAEHESTAQTERPAEFPDAELPRNPRDFKTPNYGLPTFASLFTDRQLVALSTFSSLVAEGRDLAFKDAISAGLGDDGESLESGGSGALAYADAIATYLSFAISKLADWSSTICSWIHTIEGVRDTFARQAIPMVWDYVEINPFSTSVGNFANHIDWVAEAVSRLPSQGESEVRQLDVRSLDFPSSVIATDPPYYDNIGYADLSDYFYVWMRRSLGSVHPNLFSTLMTPKTSELVATPYRFEGKKAEADRFFEEGLNKAFSKVHEIHRSEIPMTVVYGFKQSETEAVEGVTASTGWETMLKGLLDSGFAISGTWPIRSERSGRPMATGTNALASSIVLVCRLREGDAPLATRREFISSLHDELPEALRHMQQGSIAPVDLAQASIGPGMAVFSRYSKVMEADGTPMTVRTALGLINQVLDEVLAEQESEYDAETRWAVAWFEQQGFKEGLFGVAETLSKAKNTSVKGMQDSGILRSAAGKARLLTKEEMNSEWDPMTDPRLTLWEITHYLVARLETEGERGAADLLRKVGDLGEAAKDLAYRLFTICDRKKWAEDALGYNALVTAWPEISRLASLAPEGQSAMEI